MPSINEPFIGCIFSSYFFAHTNACSFFFFNDTAPTEIYTLSLHDALPITFARSAQFGDLSSTSNLIRLAPTRRSEEHTPELQSRQYLVCRLMLEKNKIGDAAARGLVDFSERSSGGIRLQHGFVAPCYVNLYVIVLFFFLMIRRQPSSTLFPNTTLFR